MEKKKNISQNFRNGMNGIVTSVSNVRVRIKNVLNEDASSTMDKEDILVFLKEICSELNSLDISKENFTKMFRYYELDLRRLAYLKLLNMKLKGDICSNTLGLVFDDVMNRVNILGEELNLKKENMHWLNKYMSKKKDQSLDFSGVSNDYLNYMKNHNASINKSYTHNCGWCNLEFKSEKKDADLCESCSKNYFIAQEEGMVDNEI